MASNGTTEDWKEKIKVKLMLLYKDKDLDALMRIMWYLDNEDKTYINSTKTSPVWRSLNTAQQCSDEIFERYAERVAEDTKRAENDASFSEAMNSVYEQMMDQSEETVPEESHQGFEVMRLADANLAQRTGCMGMVQSWKIIPVPSLMKYLEKIKPKFVANNRQLVTCADEVVDTVSKNAGTIIMVGLAVAYISYDAYNNIMRWRREEISGRRCAKNIVDSFVTIVAGAGGGVGGGAIGGIVGCAAFGPIGASIGAFTGGFIGGMIGSSVANLLIDRVTQTLFGLPKEEALENAYRFFGVKITASNYEINTAFRQLCLKHHPDKGGKTEEFLIVQLNFAVIKQHRENFG